MKEASQIFDVAKYLARIGLEEPSAVAGVGRLKLLQRQHLLNVPFENLDIHSKQAIVLDTEKFYRKIVNNNRGGFCYELNGLFNELLRELGFETRILSARVAKGNGEFNPEYDHAALMVIFGELHYLADVGFGDFTAEPLQFVPDLEQQDDNGTFVIRSLENENFEVLKKENDAWRSEYMFKPYGRDLSEFQARCDWQQTSPESHFTKGRLCSLMTLEGRKTLTDKSYIVTRKGEKNETPITSEEEFNSILVREFGIVQRAASVV
jgi:N-hydroxyarylamine O-acetyltransferase